MKKRRRKGEKKEKWEKWRKKENERQERAKERGIKKDRARKMRAEKTDEERKKNGEQGSKRVGNCKEHSVQTNLLARLSPSKLPSLTIALFSELFWRILTLSKP